MLKVILTVGAQASGKSTWAKKEVATDPLNYIRISNDDLRASFNGSVFSSDYEKLIRETRLFLLKEGLKRGKNIIIDNTNISKRCWEDCVKVCQSANVDMMLLEKLFYGDLEELLERNSKREGVARVPDEVVKKFWKDLGGKSFASRKPRTETFTKRDHILDAPFTPLEQDITKKRALIVDIDGTYATLNGNRSPYDCSKAHELDSPNIPVITTVKLYWENGYDIIFCSGREDKYEEQTINFIEQHFDGDYYLYMRKTGDQRKDCIVKEEIFNNHIKGNWYILFVLDDRMQVVSKWREIGLTCFQVAPGDF